MKWLLGNFKILQMDVHLEDGLDAQIKDYQIYFINIYQNLKN